jgi:hypothetical protein
VMALTNPLLQLSSKFKNPQQEWKWELFHEVEKNSFWFLIMWEQMKKKKTTWLQCHGYFLVFYFKYKY